MKKHLTKHFPKDVQRTRSIKSPSLSPLDLFNWKSRALWDWERRRASAAVLLWNTPRSQPHVPGTALERAPLSPDVPGKALVGPERHEFVNGAELQKQLDVEAGRRVSFFLVLPTKAYYFTTLNMRVNVVRVPMSSSANRPQTPRIGDFCSKNKC